MSIMSPHEKLLAAFFGCSKEQQEALDTEKAASEAAQSEKDWAEAKRVAEMATADFPQHKWMPALMYGWQACAIAITEDGKALCAKIYGDSVGHSMLSDYDVENTEVKV